MARSGRGGFGVRGGRRQSFELTTVAAVGTQEICLSKAD